ncbi:MAG: hypothetical protein HY782_25175 [Chloroflexi bacterium]|nr:hypothetical protein [Chloroflexota bacterium]
MYTFMIEFAAVVLFLGSAWHAARYEGRWFAQQWFVAAYVFGLLRETVMQVVFQMPLYASGIARLGAAPAVLSLLWGSLFYLAYVFARRFAPPDEEAPFAALTFLIAASFALPIEATAAQFEWWVYPGASLVLFGAMPVLAPLVWGGAAALYWLFIHRINKSRLPDRGRVYAMITFAPIVALLHVVYTLLLSAVLG